ncbi:MAG: alpha/beta fold hydrolase [Myxococcales bacterium]|nr:alpha/beta fold hydrolase [Myxococcales bacterium]
MRSRSWLVFTGLAVMGLGAGVGGCRGWWRRDADAGADAAVRGAVTVTLPNATDGWSAVGSFVAAERPRGALLFVHQLGSDRTEWAPALGRLIADRDAPAALALDLRGHGESGRNPDGVQVSWRSFERDPARWQALALDVAAGVRFLSLHAQASRVVVVGAGVGGSAAALAAAEEANVAALVLISPGLEYHGVRLEDALRRYLATGRRVLLVAGDGDRESVEAVEALQALQQGLVDRVIEGGNDGHGVSLLRAAPDRWGRLFQWADGALGNAPPTRWNVPPLPASGENR